MPERLSSKECDEHYSYLAAASASLTTVALALLPVVLAVGAGLYAVVYADAREFAVGKLVMAGLGVLSWIASIVLLSSTLVRTHDLSYALADPYVKHDALQKFADGVSARRTWVNAAIVALLGAAGVAGALFVLQLSSKL